MSVRVNFRSVNKSFGTQQVLRDISLQINPGEFFVLVGASGVGKTTLLNLVVGLDIADSGEVCFDGSQSVNNRPPVRVGYVPQGSDLFPHLTVRQNVSFPLQAIRQKSVLQVIWGLVSKPPASDRARVDEVLEIVGLTSHSGKLPGQLSGGEKQRTAIARAIVHSPEILCMDEPLSSLDQPLRLELQAEIRSLQRRLGTTTIYVTHDPVEASRLADRVAILDSGFISQLGSFQQVYLQPTTPHVAQLTGECNLMHIVGLTGPGDLVALTQSGACLNLPKPVSAGCMVGIRPESLSLTSSPDKPHLLCVGLLSDSRGLGMNVEHEVTIGNQETMRVREYGPRHHSNSTCSLYCNPSELFFWPSAV